MAPSQVVLREGLDEPTTQYRLGMTLFRQGPDKYAEAKGSA